MSGEPLRLSRRRLLAAGGVAAAGFTLGGARSDAATRAVPQAGIVTPPLPALAFGAFDVAADAAALRELLRSWSAASSRIADATVTVGLGPSLFDERFGLAGSRPPALAQLPAFAGDALDPARCGGDLAVQVCARDVATAEQVLATFAGDPISLRWQQAGFGRAASTSRRQRTPRNLMGFKDGTANIRVDDRRALQRYVWARDPAWMADGTYMVVRRIRMDLLRWDAAGVYEQERTIGRFRSSGAPLTGHHEFDRPDFQARLFDGRPVIPRHAHIRLAASGTRILRRGYSYDDGVDQTGQRDAGLFFISFQRDPRQFVQLQQRLSRNDALGEYIAHTGSAVFACPRLDEIRALTSGRRG